MLEVGRGCAREGAARVSAMAGWSDDRPGGGPALPGMAVGSVGCSRCRRFRGEVSVDEPVAALPPGCETWAMVANEQRLRDRRVRPRIWPASPSAARHVGQRRDEFRRRRRPARRHRPRRPRTTVMGRISPTRGSPPATRTPAPTRRAGSQRLRRTGHREGVRQARGGAARMGGAAATPQVGDTLKFWKSDR